MQGKTTASGIEGLGERLKGINPHDGWNPHGNCMACAIEAAEVLTHGRAPALAAQKVVSLPKGRKKFKEFEEEESAAEVWGWLLQNLQANTVYLVERSNDVDHVWNLVRDVKGDIYLIDSNQHTFRRLTGPSSGEAEVRNGPDDEVEMNYLDGHGVEVYEWGPLHSSWAALL
jgi:hypothetical protein